MDVIAIMVTVPRVDLDTGVMVARTVALRTVRMLVTKATGTVWNVRTDTGEISVRISAHLIVT